MTGVEYASEVIFTKVPYTSPLWASCRMSFWWFVWNRVITVPHCRHMHLKKWTNVLVCFQSDEYNLYMNIYFFFLNRFGKWWSKRQIDLEIDNASIFYTTIAWKYAARVHGNTNVEFQCLSTKVSMNGGWLLDLSSSKIVLLIRVILLLFKGIVS